MPVQFKIAQNYLDKISEEDEARVFNPEKSNDIEFREFMVSLFLQQQKTNAELKGEVTKLSAQLTKMEKDNNDAHTYRDNEIKALQEENKALRSELTKFNKEIKEQIEQVFERTVEQERHSRSFNLRFPGFKECTSKEDRQKEDSCAKIKAELSKVGLGHVSIENAHRVGSEPVNPDKPRQIIARFLYRPEKKLVWKKRKELWNLDVRIFEDLCKSDKDRKEKYVKQIQDKFNNGDRVWFSRGYYYVNNVKQTHMI